MVQAIEILKDGSQVCYESDDIEAYDDLVCVTDPDLPRVDLTKVKSMEIAAERTNSEVVYKNTVSISRAQAMGIANARTVTSEPVTIEHSTYYVYLKFEGKRTQRKFIIDEEIAYKIEQIQEDKDFLTKYEPTYHPSAEEVERAINEENSRKKGIWFISGLVVFFLFMIFSM